MPLQSRKIAPPQLLPKAALQSCYQKPRPKEAPKNSKAAARSYLKAGPESCPKLLAKAVPRRCSPKLFSKALAPKLRFCKLVHQNGSPKPFRKAAPESCAPKLLPKAAPQVAVQNYCPKAAILQTYSPRRLPKAILQSGSRKLLPKVATESCSPKLSSCRRKLLPKLLLFESIVHEGCSGKLAKAAP